MKFNTSQQYSYRYYREVTPDARTETDSRNPLRYEYLTWRNIGLNQTNYSKLTSFKIIYSTKLMRP